MKIAFVIQIRALPEFNQLLDLFSSVFLTNDLYSCWCMTV